MAKSDSSSSRRRWLILAAVAMSLSVTIAVVVLLRDLVEQRFARPPAAPRVVLANQPAWMSRALAEQIIGTVRPVGVHSVFDRPLLVETARAMTLNPWIKEVRQVRRAYVRGPGDTLEVDCIYRVPTALVKWDDYYWLVDGDGVKLPAQYPRRDLQRAMLDDQGRLTLRVIQGVVRPPVRTGKPWPGDDLAAGLELAKLLAGQAFAEEIPVVDVSNFGGRRDPEAAQIVLITRYGTQVRWGRPPSAKDYFIEVPTSQKLQCLADIFAEMHRVDGGQPWIDVRFDRVTYPSPQPAAATGSAGQPVDGSGTETAGAN
jgi:hypothetical protein